MTSSVWTTVLLLVGISYVASQSWVVEVYFVVEPKVVKNRLSLGYNASMAESTIRSDIDYFIYQINKFYKTLEKYGLSIEIRAKQLDILTEEIFEDCHLIRSELLKNSMSLDVATKWLAKKDAYKTVGYDTVVIYTGFNLFADRNDGVAGVSFLNETCHEDGIAVVEFDGTMLTAVVTAHEIGHSIGALHDTNTLASPCSSRLGWIMNARTITTNANRWAFSPCTAIAIKNYISSLSNNCLNSTTAPAPTFQLADAVNSDILDMEKICQRVMKGPRGYFCHYDDFYHDQAKGDEVCQKVWCGTKNGPLRCTRAMPSDGMICDANKRCEKGRCVTSSIPTEVDTNCVFGDIQSESIYDRGQTCPQYIGTDDYKCYKDWVHRERCCRTCGPKRRDIPGCEYGDKARNCGKYPIYDVCGLFSEICCETCRYYTSKRSPPSHHKVTITDLSKDPITVPHAKEGSEENDVIMESIS